MSSNDSRKHNFDGYHAKRVASRESLVQKAVDVLSSGQYATITALARDVAKIVTELERKGAKEGENPKPPSYTTFLRANSKYKHILIASLEGAPTEDDDLEKELDELKLHCVNVEHENELLRNRLDSLGDPGRVEKGSDDQVADQASQDIAMLIRVIDRLVESSSGLWTTIYPNGTDEDHPDPGLYGPDDGLVADYGALERLGKLRNDLK